MPIISISDGKAASSTPMTENGPPLDEGRLAAIFAAASVGLSELTAEGRFVRVNQELCRMLGRPEPALLGASIADVTHPDDLAESLALVQGVLAGGGTASIDKRYIRPDGSLVWANSRATLLPGPEPGHLLVVTVDMTERRADAEKLRTESERLRLAIDVGRLATWDWDMVSGAVAWNEEHFHVQGYRPGEVTPSYAAWAARVHPEDLPGAEAAITRARETRAVYVHQFRHLLPDGSVRWCAARGRFLYDAAGRAVRMIGVMEDVTEARAAQQAQAESERRLRALVAGIPQLVFRADGSGRRSWVSPQWTIFTGLGFEASLGLGWLEAIHPDDRASTQAAWAALDGRNELAVEHRIRDARNQSWRWHQTRATPVKRDDGSVEEWLGTSTDIDELRSLQRHQQLLLAELQHRVRNTLGVIRTIARRTAEASATVDDMAAHLVGRLEAFSRVQSAVTRDPSGGVALTGLIEDELLAHAAREGRQLSLRGPELLLNARAAESFSLAIHELATNAVKHGALSGRRGQIDVRWTVEDGQFELVWKEFGRDEPLDAPRNEGFGMDLLLRGLPYDLGVETNMVFEPGGLRFVLKAPLADVAHPQEPRES